jgi:antitoxin CptB
MEKGQLRWRCRRGMKELDVLFQRYLDERLESAESAELAAFEALLEIQDPVIYGYCFGSLAPPPQFAQLIERITGRPSG